MKNKLIASAAFLFISMQLFANVTKPLAVRSILVNCHNLTNFDCKWVSGEFTHGIVSHHDALNKDLYPPTEISANSSVQWASESDGVMTGTEGHVSYQILDGRNSNFYFHWNNPYASNAYGTHYNTFNETISDGYIIYLTGNHRDYNEVVDLYIDYPKTAMVPGFLPSTSGFKFANKWSDFGYTLPFLDGWPGLEDIKLGDASNGLCGGMAYAVKDYFEAKTLIPGMTSPPNDRNNIYTKYIIERLFNSFTGNDVSMYMKLMSPLYADTDEGTLNSMGQMGRAYVTIREEWPMIKQDIDNGHPSPIGLIRVKSAWIGDLGQNHQVLVYGYSMNTTSVSLNIYDPNIPLNDNVTLTFTLQGVDKPVYAFFRTNYSARNDFPVYTPSTGVKKMIRFN
jgi:hypothetical protein